MDYYNKWKEEENKSFQGWDFSHLDGRMIEEPLPWDYKEVIQQHLTKDMMLLDLGTGGGEFLLTLNHPYDKTAVTEGYEPNYQLCMERLRPLGVQVKKIYEGDLIPYEDNMFDIVINRHESSNIEEIKRVLKPGGYYITQQVGEKNNINLSDKLLGPNNDRIVFDNDYLVIVNRLKKKGFNIIRQEECSPKVIFKDVGAFVYFAKIIEWEYVGFSVDTHYDKLLEFQKEIEETGSVIGKAHRYLIIARKKQNQS